MTQFDTDKSWSILSPIEQSIKAKIEAIGTPLKDWDISINYGIKTGCNDAFIINQTKRDELIDKDPKSAEIIRPYILGEDYYPTLTSDAVPENLHWDLTFHLMYIYTVLDYVIYLHKILSAHK